MSTSAPAIIFPGPTMEATQRSTPVAASNSSRARKSTTKNTAGRDTSQTGASSTNLSPNNASTEPVIMQCDNYSARCAVCHSRMLEDEVSCHIDQKHAPSPLRGQFEGLPITTPIDQLPAYAKGYRIFHSQVPQMPVVHIPVYGLTAAPWECHYPYLSAPVHEPCNAVGYSQKYIP